jgi:large subunit ribosomal protein L24
MNIRKNDTVLVTQGEFKGRRGRVLRVLLKEERLLVEGVNMMKRHTKPTNRNQKGGIVEREAPIHMSNVMPWCEAVGAPSRIIMRRLEDGTRVRVYKINGETLND